jgi:hypothetical protein
MSSVRLGLQLVRPSMVFARPISTTPFRMAAPGNAKEHPAAEEQRKGSVPENTGTMTGGTQKGAPGSGPQSELGVGEMEGAKFKIEPLRRTGEDPNTTRARLLCSQHPLCSTC